MTKIPKTSILSIGTDGMLKKMDPNYGTEDAEITPFQLILATAKRTRQLTDEKLKEYADAIAEGRDRQAVYRDFNPLQQATEELYNGKVKVIISSDISES